MLSARRLHYYLYNACVSHRETEYKLHRRTVTYLEQQNLLPEFKQVLNQMITYKIEQKGGLVLILPTQTLKPSQRCPQCGAVHKEWADLSNRYHVCSDCGFETPRDQGGIRAR